jgi:hypothetical protein
MLYVMLLLSVNTCEAFLFLQNEEALMPPHTEWSEWSTYVIIPDPGLEGSGNINIYSYKLSLYPHK